MVLGTGCHNGAGFQESFNVQMACGYRKGKLCREDWRGLRNVGLVEMNKFPAAAASGNFYILP